MKTNLSKQLKSVLINNFSQSYKNHYWTIKNGKIIKRRQHKNDKIPYKFTKRPYTPTELKKIRKITSRMTVNNQDYVGLMEKLDMKRFMLSSNRILGNMPLLKQLNEDFPKYKRIKIRKMLLDFVKDKGNVVYGGYAINAYLLDNIKIYSDDTIFTPDLLDLDSVFPDIDVFSMRPKTDLFEFARLLKNSGFKYIEVKPGMHEGTWKLYVSFINICDFTKPEQGVPYNLIRGVKYASTDYLKAQLYKILSDPSGDVSIWQKTALRLDRLEHSTNVMVRKNPNIIYDPKSKYQRYVTRYYGPKSKARRSEKLKLLWHKKTETDKLKKSYTPNNINKLNNQNLTNVHKIQVLKKSDNNITPWDNKMKGLRLT